MRYHGLSIFFWIGVIVICLCGTVSAQVPTTGLVGAWPFSGNANDQSGNANHGTVTNATLTADRCGNANSAYAFNGVNAYILMLSPGPTGTVSRSLSFWLKTNNTALSPVVCFDYGLPNSNGGTFQMVFNYNCQGVGIDVSNAALIRGSCLSNNAWHHVVAVYNATISNQIGSVQFYIDGVLQPLINCNVSGTVAAINTATNLPVNIGRGCTNVRFFNGALDDYYLYNRVLTPTEIAQLYTVMPCANAVSGPTAPCIGSAVSYSANAMAGASSYSWSIPGGWTGTSTTNVITVTVGANPGIINVLGLSTGTCGNVGGASLSVTPVFGNAIAVISSNYTLCVGSSATLTGSGVINYSWQPGGATTTSIAVNPTTTTIYSITGTSANGCISRGTFTQVVVPLPSLTISATPSIVCAGAPSTLIASGALNYTWLPSNTNGSQILLTPSATSIYTVIASNISSCSNSKTIAVSVFQVPSYTLSTSAATACPSQSVTLDISGGASYTWIPSNLTGSQVIVFPNVQVSYTVLCASVNGCSSTISYTQYVYPLPSVSISPASPTVCPATNTILTSLGANSYTWFPGGIVSNSLQVSPVAISIYTVIGSSVNNCTAPAIQTVYIKPTPTLSFNTFSITCGSLGSATVNASGGIGPFTYSWLPTNQSGQTVSGLFPGTYSVTVTDIGTSCIQTHTTFFAPLVPLTGTVSASDSLFCPLATTGTAGISLSGGSGNYNYLYTGSSYSSSVASPTNLGNGQHTISVTDQLTFCNVTHTFFIAQPTPFNLAISASSPSICMGDSILVAALNSGGTPAYSYTWQNAFVGNQYYAKESLPGKYTYTFVSNDSRLCSTTKTISLLFVPNPTVTVASVSLCPMAPFTLLASGASTYSWSSGQTGASRPIAFATGTVLTVTGTSLGCSAQAKSSITIYPAPIPTLSSNAPLCAGGTLTLNVIGGVSYQWQGPNSFTSSQSSFSFASSSASLTGNYQVTVTSINACTTSATKYALVNLLPFFTAVGSTVCAGSTATLTSSYLSGGSYLWLGPSYSATTQIAYRTNATPTMTGQYTLTATTAAGCSATAAPNLSVVTPPTTTITGATSICVGNTLSLLGVGGGNYFWNGPNSFYNTQASATISAITLNASGVYTLTTVFGPCTQKVTHTLTVNPLPTVSITGNAPLCENTSLQLQTGNFQSYSWTLPNGSSANTAAVQISAIGLSQQGTYSLHVIDANGCAGSASYYVSVLPAPLLVANNSSVCIGSKLTMTVSGAQTYTWSSTQAPTLTGSVYPIASAAASLAGAYFISSTGSNSCSSTKQIQLSVLALDLPAVQTKTLVQVCDNSFITLSASGGSAYTWFSPFSTAISQNTLLVNGSDSLAAGIYSVLTAGDNGCNITSTVQVIKVFAPKASLLANQTFCAPLCNNLSINPADTYSATYFLNGTQLDANKVCIPAAGQYTIQALVSGANKCAIVLQTVVVAGEKPKADFFFSPKTMALINEPVYLYNNSSAPPRSTLQWFFNDTLVPESNQENPVHYFPAGGKYPIVLVVRDNIGCADSTIQIIEIGDEFTLYVPNSFSPNGDGINDVFMPKGMGIKNYELSIFNRWGQLLFSSNEAGNCWDGRYKGSDCKADTYQWVITSLDYKGQRKTTMGTVTVVR